MTDEYWYSESLRIYLVIKHDDPRTGSVSMTVSEVTVSEPAQPSSEFQMVMHPPAPSRGMFLCLPG